MARVPAREATRKRVKRLVEAGESTDRSSLIRESVRLMIEEALEPQVPGRQATRSRFQTHVDDPHGHLPNRQQAQLPRDQPACPSTHLKFSGASNC